MRQVHVLPHRHAADARHPRPHLRRPGQAAATWRSWKSWPGRSSAGSLCGLGKTAPNPVLTTLRYFRDEYEAHLAGRCPAGSCKELIPYRITETASAARFAPSIARPTPSRMTPYAQHRIDLENAPAATPAGGVPGQGGGGGVRPMPRADRSISAKWKCPPGRPCLARPRKLGIDIPTLCHLEGYQPSTSCLVCMVKIRRQRPARLVPFLRHAGGRGDGRGERNRRVFTSFRRTALELLLSDHVGDCLAPCHFACPAHMDVPDMLRQITAEDWRAAIVTDQARHRPAGRAGADLPQAVRERVPPQRGRRAGGGLPTEAICRRRRPGRGLPYLPPLHAAHGPRVAIIGAGPTGLSAAYYLASAAMPAWSSTTSRGPAADCGTSPSEPSCRGKCWMRKSPRWCGPASKSAAAPAWARPSPSPSSAMNSTPCWWPAAPPPRPGPRLGLAAGPAGIAGEQGDLETGVRGVFAAGNAIRSKGLAVRSVADGKEAAAAIDQYLSGQTVCEPARPFSSRIGRRARRGNAATLAHAKRAGRGEEPADGPSRLSAQPQAAEQAAAACIATAGGWSCAGCGAMLPCTARSGPYPGPRRTSGVASTRG